MQPRALITGVTGQDGSYLCELLLAKGYQVHGIMRRCSSFTTGRIDHLYEDSHASDVQLHLHYGDLLDPLSLCRIIGDVKPHEVYNLAAQSHVKTSFDQPAYTAEVVGLGTLNLLEAIRDHQDHTGNAIRFYQASSSEMYGNTPQRPQDETTPFAPASPYACAKAYAFWQTVNYRQAYNMFACNGILFNHESPRRGETFVTRKVTRAATRIKLGLQDKLYLGNLDASRDWGFAGDYVEAMWLMLQHHTPDDYVVATGDSRTVRQWLDQVFGLLDLDWHSYVEIDPRYFRPTEVDHLQGDARKIRQSLKWQPQTDFAELARMMTEADMETAKKEQTLAMAGYTV